MSLTDPDAPVTRPEARPQPEPPPWRADEAHAGMGANALALGLLAGVGALVVLVFGLWLTRDDTRADNAHPWQSALVYLAVMGLSVVSIRQLATWNRLRKHPMTAGGLAWVLLGTGLTLLLVVAAVLHAAGAPEWTVGTAGTVGLVALIGAGTIALLQRSGRSRRSGDAADASPQPGSGSDYTEWALHGVTGAPGALPPTRDEEAVLERAIAEEYGSSSSGAVLLSLPSVARQADLVLPLPAPEAAVRAREVLGGAGARLVGDWAEADRATLRGWWQSGPHLNGCPVVVTVWLGSEDPQTARATVRATSKVFLLNRHLPERALERVVTGLGGPPGPDG